MARSRCLRERRRERCRLSPGRAFRLPPGRRRRHTRQPRCWTSFLAGAPGRSATHLPRRASSCLSPAPSISSPVRAISSFQALPTSATGQQVIAGMHPHWLWRVLLVVVGVAAYYGAMLIVGTSLVRYLGVPISDRRASADSLCCPTSRRSCLRLSRPYGTRSASALFLNRSCRHRRSQLRRCSSCGTTSRRATTPGPNNQSIRRNYAWIAVAAALALVFILILGPGVRVHR